MKSLILKLMFFCLFVWKVNAQNSPPKPYGPIPTTNQLRWQQMEYYAFVHLSINTYTDMAWGFGNEDPKIFNPEKLDCRQWARICKEAGMKGIILRLNTTADFVYGLQNTLIIPLKNRHRKMAKVIFYEKCPMPVKNLG